MIAEPRPLIEITQEAIRLLYRELGLVDTVRFVNQFTHGYGNYTEERRKLLEDQTLKEAIADVREYQATRSINNRDS